MPDRACIIIIFLSVLTFCFPLEITARTIKTDQPVIVIDPGHGGSRAGITSTHAIEKEICLILSQKIAETLEARYNVTLTRNSDETLSSARRVTIANAMNADLFISIHLGRHGSRTGFVYYYTLPEREISAPDQQMDWKTIPLAHTNSSKRFAKTLADYFSSRSSALTFHAKPAPLRALQGADMPAVLIEAVPISNLPADRSEREAVLASIAENIRQGIDIYFKISSSSP